MKIYTRTGDKGQTSLFGGERVTKTHHRVQAYGTLDELNSQLGVCVALAREEKVSPAWMLQVQRDLFALGSWLASKEASERVAKGEEAFSGARTNRTHLDEKRIQQLEKDIDGWETTLVPMKTFILPGGSLLAAQVHIARTLCRRAERETVALKESGEVVPDLATQYLNRLADALFVYARHLNHEAKVQEDPWE